jgi:prepilin-type processing-associated H-X9-DG protein
MSCAILGLGTAVPSTTINQDDAARMASRICCRTDEHRTWLPLLFQHTGIRTRHVQFDPAVIRDVDEGTRHSGSVFLPSGAADDLGPTTRQRMDVYRPVAEDLAVRAAGAALRAAGQDPGGITHLITVSCTGFQAPGVDLVLVRRLALSPAVARTHVGFMGCHGALNGLRVAQAFTAADPAARVLLSATEVCSLHFRYGWDPQRMVANALFADGSAAAVGAAAGPAGAWRVRASGSTLLPDSADAMTWSVGDHGFEMTLSKQVPALIGRHLRPWLTTWLAGLGLDLAAVGVWAVHPGGPRVLDVVEDALGLGRDALAVSRGVFADYGNMSSPTVLFILDRLARAGAPGPCVALGFGPGMTVEAALLSGGEVVR